MPKWYEYRLSTGLWETKTIKARNDKEAWERLRKYLPGKYAQLLKVTNVVFFGITDRKWPWNNKNAEAVKCQ